MKEDFRRLGLPSLLNIANVLQSFLPFGLNKKVKAVIHIYFNANNTYDTLDQYYEFKEFNLET